MFVLKLIVELEFRDVEEDDSTTQALREAERLARRKSKVMAKIADIDDRYDQEDLATARSEQARAAARLGSALRKRKL